MARLLRTQICCRETQVAGLFRVKIRRPEMVQGGGVICGPVAAPRHQKTASGERAGTDGTQDARSAPVYQKMRLTAAVERGRAHLRFLQDAFRMMKIIEPVYLCNIDGGGLTIKKSRAPLVARHVEWIGVA